MSEIPILESIIKFKDLCRKNKGLEYLDSIVLVFLDRTKNQKRSDISFFKTLLLSFLFYFFAFSLSVVFFIDNLVRLIFAQNSPKQNILTKSLLVTFGHSHTSVLNKVPVIITGEYPNGYISSRTLAEALRYSEHNTVYVDSYNSLFLTFTILINHLYKSFTSRHYLIFFLKYFNLDISISEFIYLLISYFQSVRFHFWVMEFNKFHTSSNIFFGNDTCYRAYWIINTNKEAKSLTIQHGLIENKLLYYSIADKFLCWDNISLNLLWKNPTTEYCVVGYPKLITKQYSIAHAFETSETKKSVIILTKLFTISNAKKLYLFVKALELNGLLIDIKLHPLENISVINFFNKKIHINNSFLDWYKYENIFVVDSTFAIDLNMIGLPIIPLTLLKDGAFNNYYNVESLEDIISLINSSTNINLCTFFLSRKQMVNIDTNIRVNSFNFNTL